MNRIALLLLAPILIFSACNDASLFKTDGYTLYADKVEQEGSTATVISPVEIESDFEEAGSWKLSADLSAFPRFTSDIPITEAMYNLSVEELTRNLTPEGRFVSSKGAADLSSRDIGYAGFLGLGVVAPGAVKASLMSRVKAGRILQEPGIGGSWPVWVDRVSWILSAWDYYKITGDKNFLMDAYGVAVNALNEDLKVLFNRQYSLISGGSYFSGTPGKNLPSYMEPVDVFTTMSLTNNATYYQVFRVAEQMAAELGQPSGGYMTQSKKVSIGINKYLWNPEKGYYNQFLYGRNFHLPSNRAESLGEALTVLFEIANDQQSASLFAQTPGTPFGLPASFPAGAPNEPGLNGSVYPMVNGYWAWAAAKSKNANAALYAISSIYRPASLLLSNRLSVSSQTGGTESQAAKADGHLWSIAANLSVVYRVYFGLDFQAKGLAFFPVVPEKLGGVKKLSGLKYRNAVLDITLSGFGTGISSFKIDGAPAEKFYIPAEMEGAHTIEIVMNGQKQPAETLNIQPALAAAPDLQYTTENNTFNFSARDDIAKYQIYQNGTVIKELETPAFSVTESALSAEFIFSATDRNGFSVYGGAPFLYSPPQATLIVEAETAAPRSSFAATGYTGSGFLDLTTKSNRVLKYTVNIDKLNVYLIDLRYANGNGPIDGGDKCAIRQLYVDNTLLDAFVMPQRGENAWSDWGYSNPLRARLSKGTHTISIEYESQNENMNGAENRVLIDHIRLIKE
ncbi:MAG: hypothetical protein AB7C90_06305 [Bacteroidales bacterium]